MAGLAVYRGVQDRLSPAGILGFGGHVVGGMSVATSRAAARGCRATVSASSSFGTAIRWRARARAVPEAPAAGHREQASQTGQTPPHAAMRGQLEAQEPAGEGPARTGLPLPLQAMMCSEWASGRVEGTGRGGSTAQAVRSGRGRCCWWWNGDDLGGSGRSPTSHQAKRNSGRPLGRGLCQVPLFPAAACCFPRRPAQACPCPTRQNRPAPQYE